MAERSVVNCLLIYLCYEKHERLTHSPPLPIAPATEKHSLFLYGCKDFSWLNYI